MEMLQGGGAPDDLTKIKGIGAKLEGKLNGFGVYYFRQIADWTDEEVAEMDKHLGFPGRIVRDQWREQAKALMGGEGGEE
jgi:NADH-quinone oxidoreductase subunit E